MDGQEPAGELHAELTQEQLDDLQALARRARRVEQRRLRRMAAGVALAVVLGGSAVVITLTKGSHQPRSAATTERRQSINTATTPAPASDRSAAAGRPVKVSRLNTHIEAHGRITVLPSAHPDQVRLQISVSVPGRRAWLYLRTIGGHYRRMYEVLGDDTQTTTWARSTLRQYRSLVVLGRADRSSPTLLFVPTYELLGEAPRKRAEGAPANPDAERNLHRLILERTRGSSREACKIRRADRPRRATAQWVCRVVGIPVRYLRFRTRQGYRAYADLLRNTTAPFVSSAKSCPQGESVGWSRTNYGKGAKGAAALRKRAAGLVLMITYSGRRTIAVAHVGSAGHPDRLCKVWWYAS